MSNTNDPIQPDPAKKPAKPEDTPGDENPSMDVSAFDFVLPEGAGSGTDLPVPPVGGDSDPNLPSVPAVPTGPMVRPLSSHSFDFIDLPNLPDNPLSTDEMDRTPTVPVGEAHPSVDSSVSLPSVGAAPPPGGESAVDFDPVPTADPASSFTMGSSVADLELPPDVPDAPLSATSVPDIASMFPQPPVPDASGSSVGLGELDLPMADPVSDGSIASVPTSDLESAVGTGEPVKPASGWLDKSGESAPAPTGRSSFDFALPEGVNTYSDLPPVPQPDPGETVINQAALPPSPAATRPTSSNTFDFLDLPDAPAGSASGSGLQQVTATPAPVEPPLLTPTDGVIDLSAADPAGAPPAEPVEPAAGWLDSDVQPTPPVPTADLIEETFEPAPAEQAKSSDIFSGSRTAPALSAEQSDVTAATTPAPAGDPRPSDIALNFDAPPGGSTIADSAIDMPVADEDSDSSTLLGEPSRDPESIHDMPGMSVPDPLFDSARLADAPDLPASPADAGGAADAPSYGAMPDYSPDASSILADLSDPDVRDPGADSSSVRFESPNMPRTVGGEPAEGGFDLTVPEEPIPADLFGEPSEAPEAGWVSPGGADLFAKGGAPAEAEIDLGAGPVQKGDAGRTGEPPLSSTSSIFSGAEPAVSVSPSGSAHIDVPDAGDADAAEFAAFPAMADTTEREKSAPPAVPPKSRSPHGLSSADFELPAATTDADDSAISGVLRGLDDSAEVPTKNSRPVDEVDTPSVTVDWMAGSSEGSAVSEPVKTEPTRAKDRGKPAKKEASAEAKAKPARPAAPAPDKAAEKEKHTPGQKGGGMLVGLVAGAILAGGACAGAYFGGLVPNEKGGTAKVGQQPPPPPPPPTTTPATSAKDAFAAGNLARALELVKAKQPETPEEKATAGSTRVYAKIGGHGTDDDLKQGQADLQAAIQEAGDSRAGVQTAVKATIDLGVSYEVSGQTEEAKKLFTEAKAKYPTHADIFEALLLKLDAPPVPSGTSFRAPRLTPDDARQALLAAVLLVQDPPAPKTADDPEPGLYYWKAVKLAAANDFDEAIKQIGLAKEAHIKRAKLFPGRGLNPLTDPLEQMFPRACDELAQYWKMRAELYRNKGIADAIKKDGLGKTLDALAAAKGEVTKAQTDLKTEQGKTAVLDKELKAAKMDVAKLDKEVKVAEKMRDAALTDVKALETKLTTAADALADARKDAKARGEALDGIAKALAPAVKLPEKWEPADLTAAVKNLASVANDKDLKGLLERATKAETAAKVATDKLTTETKKLKDDHAAEVKKLTDGYKLDVKKLEDASAVEVKKLTDKFDTDIKTLKDDQAAALKAEQAKTAAARKELALKDITFQKQLTNAITPAQAVDIWLPVLTDLRRASDAAPALAMAERSLASSPEGSEEAAKARTLKGMALLLKADYPAARDEFQAAKRSPTYASDKPWAKVVENGLEATVDPLALYRRPVVIPPVDVKAATRALDTGVAAYRDGRYQAAITALTDAARNNPADPVAWYFLGATRFAMGETKQAEKDIGQGAEREKVSPLPGRFISAALAPIQGEVRDTIDRARP